jgi:hypothetical protein
MSIFAGPKIVEDGLVFSIDAANRKFISPLGNNSFNGAAEIIRSTIPGITVNSFNGVSLGNLNYYTVFAIDFPEGTYGGDAAGRHGMTPGLNVRSGTKTYDASRSLHMWVWNNDTNAWLSSSYFNGFRLSGHCYDNYSGAEDGYVNQINKFIADFNNIKTTFSNCTYIIMGSHRADQYNSGLRAILYDLGMPTGTDLDNDFVAAPEWILVGKPGLGTGNAYGWVYQNYTTNAAQVAHLNFGLPIFGNKDNYLSFDGVNDYIQANVNTNLLDGDPSLTVEMFVRRRLGTNIGPFSGFWGIGGSGQGNSVEGWTPEVNLIHLDFYDSTRLATSQLYPENQFIHICWTKNGMGAETSNIKCYVNGVEVPLTKTRNATRTNQFNTSTAGIGICLGRINADSASYHSPIDVGIFKVYTRALSSVEVKQNFEAKRKRYGI